MADGTAPSLNSRVVDIINTQADGPLCNHACIRYHDGQGYVTVTYSEFRDATYAAAEVFRPEFQVHAQLCLPVGYLANSGKDYALNLLALMALNATPVVLSPRNSTEILVHLLKESGAKVLVCDEEHAVTAAKCAELLPGLRAIRSMAMGRDPAKQKPASVETLVVTPLTAGDQTCLILHSSGSTSVPKLIRLSNRYMTSMVGRLRHNGHLAHFGTQLYLAPLFHIFGLAHFFLFFCSGGTNAFPRARMPTPRQALGDVVEATATSMVCLPFQLKQIAEHCHENTEEWRKLATVEMLMFGGATLPPTICQAYTSKGIRLQNGYGTTEVGFLALALTGKENPDGRVLSLMEGIKFSLVSVENDTAQILIHHDDPNLATGVSPANEGYVVGDRLKIVRYDEGQGRLDFEVLGRVDDTLVHVTGEKTNPIPQEDILDTHPLVQKCVMFGSNRLNCCLFVELTNEAEGVPASEIVQQINRQVDKANAAAPSHSRIDHDLVYILNPEKKLPVTVKGNVSRVKAEKLFQDEINQLYSAYEEIAKDTVPQKMDVASISAYIHQAFSKVTKKQLIPEISLFDQGMDSLLAVKFRNFLHAAYPSAKLSVDVIYELENAAALTRYIVEGTYETKDLRHYQEQVNSFITEYTEFPPATTHRISSENKIDVIVTGSNGSLGSFIIKALLERPDVGTIFSFSRAKDSNDSLRRIQAGFRERGIALASDQWRHICALPYKSEDEHLGLDAATYDRVFQSVDVIYHVAWRMDFLKGLSAFRDCIASTVNLLKISATSPRRPAFHFTSTVGATMPISTSATILEARLHSELKNVEYCNGYNLSKIVSEIVCYRWAEHFGFPLDIHRVGQVSGDTEHGAWNTREHVSLLIKAAQVMKMVPSQFAANVTWIPVDVAAKGMVEIHFSPNNHHKATINHIVNPNVTPWRSVIALLQELGIPCQEVDSETFLDQLNSNPRFQDVDVNPLAALTDFLTKFLTRPPSSLTMETHETCLRSVHISNCPRVDISLISKYLGHWVEYGFLNPLDGP